MEEKKIRMDDYVAEDRVNALPEAILHHIMSFLPFKQVVQTSVLSKTWCQAWLTFPDLVFDEALFPHDWYDYCRDQKRFGTLSTYWQRILDRRGEKKVSVRKFTFRMIFLNDLDLADRCVRHAIENNVREMIFEVSPRVCPHTCSPMYYSFPLEALSSNSLRALTLIACKLDSKLFPSNVNLSALSYLRLWCVLADEQALHNLLAGCPLIQDLETSSCRGIKSLKLLDHRKLSNVKPEYNEGLAHVDIQKALSLKSICIVRPGLHQTDIGITSCKNLSQLNVRGGSFTDEQLCNLISELPLLEDLCISSWNKIQNLKISSSRIKFLTLRACENLAEVLFETPNLSVFRYSGDIFSWTTCSLSLSEASLHFFSKNIDSQWYVKYIELLARFHQFSKFLRLHSCDCEVRLF